MTMELLRLDPNICRYVFLPILAVVLLVSVLRQKLLMLLKGDSKTELKEQKQNLCLARAKVLRANGGVLPEKAFRARRAYFTHKTEGVLSHPPETVNPLQAMASQDPSQMMGMLKSQAVFIGLNGGLAYWVHLLFSGFLVAKAPFPLTYKFKFMLQRGVELPSLDVTYVSSLSWYFFTLFASGGVYSLFMNLRGASHEDQEAMEALDRQSTMMMGGGGAAMGGGGMPGQQTDMAKVYAQERDSLDIAEYEDLVVGCEQRLLRRAQLL